MDLTSAAVLGASALLTASAGAAATHKFDCNKLRLFLGWWLYFVAIVVPLKVAAESLSHYQNQGPHHKAAHASAAPPPSSPAPHSEAPHSAAPHSAAPHSPAPELARAVAVVGGSVRGSADIVQGGGDGSAKERGGFVLRSLRGSDVALAAVGMVSGFASGLLGIGGGTVVTPLLAVLSGECVKC